MMKMNSDKYKMRYVMGFLLFLGDVATYSTRVDMSIAVVAMTDKTNTESGVPTLDWDFPTRGLILSSFFWGYVVTQIPSGFLAQVFGPKWLIFWGVGVSSITSLLIPVAAVKQGWETVCALRVIQGLSQGFIYPAIHGVISKWSPPDERSTMSTLAYAGNQVGAILAFALSGVLASSSSGWPAIFYTYGSLAAMWCVIWAVFSSDTPSTNKFISDDERDYIQRSIGNVPIKKQLNTPIISIMTSLPVWAVLIAHCTESWGYWTLMTEMPTYMDNYLGFNINQNGLMSSLPYLANAILCFVFGFLADFIIRKNVSLIWSRKIFNTIGFWGPGITLAILGYISRENQIVAVVLLVLAVGLNAGIYAGYQVNHIDLSPNFAGAMMGITNCLANIMPIIAPITVGKIVTQNGEDSASEWRTIFWIAAVLYIIGNIFFVMFGSATLQPWDNPNFNKKSDDIGDIKFSSEIDGQEVPL